MIPASVVRHRSLRRRTLAVVMCGSVMGLGGRAERTDEFMTYDPAERSVRLTVVARYDESNTGYNFNGGSHGSHRLTVPIGWRVHVTFLNRDVIPHSLGVVRRTKVVPLRVGKPVLAGAASRAFQTGIAAGGRDEFEFVAGQSGPYLLACGVTAHASIGGYLQLIISPDAPRPVYETEQPIARRPTSRGAR